MVKLTTTWDKTLNEKVFVLKGDEAYARTTDTVLTELEREADWNHNIDYMLVSFEVDVLRDKGDSTIVLYDNDEVLDVVDYTEGQSSVRWERYWDEESQSYIDNRVRLSYDVEHNVYAKYMGNKKCLKSVSKTYTFSEPTPTAFLSSITISVDDDSYYLDDTTSMTVKLNADDFYDTKPIKIYENGVEKRTVTTGRNGSVTIDDYDLETEGLRTIVARFEGDEHLTPSESSVQLSVGLILTMDDIPYHFYDTHQNIGVYLKDYKGRGIMGDYVCTEIIDGASRVYDGGSFDEDGKATIDLYGIYEDEFELSIVADEYTVNKSAKSYDVSMRTNPLSQEIVTPSYNGNFWCSIFTDLYPSDEGNNQDVDVIVNNSKIATVKMQADPNLGHYKASYLYRFNGTGAKNLQFAIGNNKSGYTSFMDLDQYWKINGTGVYRNYWIQDGLITEYSNGYQMSANAIVDFYFQPYSVMSFDVKSVSSDRAGFFIVNNENKKYNINFRLKPNTTITITADKYGIPRTVESSEGFTMNIDYEGEVLPEDGFITFNSDYNFIFDNLKMWRTQ